MQKSKEYSNTFFPPHVIKEAYELCISKLNSEKKIGVPMTMTARIGAERWNFDSIEEFLADYPKSSFYILEHYEQGCRFTVQSAHGGTEIIIGFANRPLIESVFYVFERNAETSRITDAEVPEDIPITVFVGHGRDPQWRDLKDHLQDKHGIKVIAYEVGPRAGLSIKEVLEDMLESSSFALLVLTGEDIHTDGELHARENVIHEVGLSRAGLDSKER